ncbi:MAG: MFS transporter, partial [Xanthobacteraceae bacterium]|nr:MFS transporter [Xanthobacteraceae bacterium]
VGVLAGLPVVLFALAAIPGSMLIARFGALATAIIGLVVTGLGSALRGAAPDVGLLYGATIVTGFGVAVMQPSLPPLVRAWLPDRIGFATAVYSNGLLIGEILPVALTIPVMLPLLGSSWRLAFVAWGVPCLAIAAALYALAPRPTTSRFDSPLPRKWWPDWKSSLLWRLGLMLGGVNAAYFSTNAFLPDYLNQLGRADLIGPGLTALNTGQLPASFLLLALVGRVEKRGATYLVFGALTLAGALGIVFGSGLVIVAAAALVGFAAAAVLILMLALPALLSKPEDVPRMAAGMFTISYSCAVIVPIVSGLVWDATGVPATGFVPITIAALLIIVFAPTLRLDRRGGASTGEMG